MLIRALFWSGSGAMVNMAVQLVLLGIMSRLLSASDFGLMASAALAMRFTSYFVQFGLGPALIQRKALEPAHLTAALLAAAAVGLLCWALFLLLAPVAAAYFREPRLVPVLQLLPAVMGLGALASVPQAMLRRAMRFKLLAAIDLGALVFGYGAVGVIMALTDHGVWSLVAALLAQQMVLLMLGLFASRPDFERPQARHFKELGGYGGSYSLVGFLEFLSCSVETLFIGRYLGTSRLGEYNRAQAITTLPVDQFMGAINRVMFPTLAALKDRPVEITRALILSLKLSALVTFPLAVCLSLVAGNLVAVALGPSWQMAGPIAAVLAWSIPAAYLSTFIGMTYDGLALFRRKTGLILAITALKVGLMVLVSGQGLTAVVEAMLFAEWVRVLLSVALLRRVLPLAWLDLGRALGRGTVAAGALGGSLMLLDAVLPQMHPMPQLLLQGLVSVAVGLPCMRWLLRGVVQESEAVGLGLPQLRRLAGI